MTTALSRVSLTLLLALCATPAVRAQRPAPPLGTNPPATAGIAAPTIIFSASPALLVLIDGDPVYRDVAGTTLQRIVNTKALILRDEGDAFYLKVLDGWMQAYALGNWWEATSVPPEGADIALRQAVASKDVDLLNGPATQGAAPQPSLADGRAPAIHVSTKPAVLVVTDGAPRFATVSGTSLEYAENTTAKLFREPTDQELYLLISGRWFRSWKTEGPWQSVAGDELPADFAKIPASRLKSNPPDVPPSIPQSSK